MKIAIDWDTVVTTDRELWAAFIKEAAFRKHDVTITHSSHVEEVHGYATHLSVAALEVPRFTQAQDALGVDIWVHGRPDRVLGVYQIAQMHEELTGS